MVLVAIAFVCGPGNIKKDIWPCIRLMGFIQGSAVFIIPDLITVTRIVQEDLAMMAAVDLMAVAHPATGNRCSLFKSF